VIGILTDILTASGYKIVIDPPGRNIVAILDDDEDHVVTFTFSHQVVGMGEEAAVVEVMHVGVSEVQ